MLVGNASHDSEIPYCGIHSSGAGRPLRARGSLAYVAGRLGSHTYNLRCDCCMVLSEPAAVRIFRLMQAHQRSRSRLFIPFVRGLHREPPVAQF